MEQGMYMGEDVGGRERRWCVSLHLWGGCEVWWAHNDKPEMVVCFGVVSTRILECGFVCPERMRGGGI